MREPSIEYRFFVPAHSAGGLPMVFIVNVPEIKLVDAEAMRRAWSKLDARLRAELKARGVKAADLAVMLIEGYIQLLETHPEWMGVEVRLCPLGRGLANA